MTALLVDVAAMAASWLVTLSLILTLVPRFRDRAWDLFFEIRWAWLPSVVWIDVISQIFRRESISWLETGLDLFLWVLIRLAKDDDDRWRKRRKKVADAVRQAGARLVVVPA